MSGVTTFDGAPPPGTINLGLGQPSADLLPLDILREASDAFFRDARPIELNYGVMQGDERFLHSLAGFLSAAYGAPVSANSLFVSGGNSQALDFVSTVFTNPGDTVFVEEPSYFLAFQIFRDHGLNLVGIPVDGDGLSIEHLQGALINQKPAFLYTIPSYQNPGGQCMSAERRKQLLALSQEHDFLIVADEVYHLLSYYDAPPPAFGTMIDGGTVVSLGSFSKVLAPALRLGWIQTAPVLQNKIMASGFSNSGGSINHFVSHIVRQAIDLGLQAAHIDSLRGALRLRSEAMYAALQTHFADLAQWTRPQGGYFYWLKFDQSVDTTPLKARAVEAQTGFQPGSLFSARGALSHCLRLSFAHYNEADILKGVERMRPLFD